MKKISEIKNILGRCMLFLIIIFCLFTSLAFLSKPAQAVSFGLPAWWSSQTCDKTTGHNDTTGNLPTLRGTWSGVQVCGGGNDYYSTFGGQWSGGIHEWECV